MACIWLFETKAPPEGLLYFELDKPDVIHAKFHHLLKVTGAKGAEYGKRSNDKGVKDESITVVAVLALCYLSNHYLIICFLINTMS